MSFAVTTIAASNVQEMNLSPEAAANAKTSKEELGLIPDPEATGVYSREGYDGSYAVQKDGSVFYSGHTNLNNTAQPQIYKDGEWAAANSEETAQGNAALLGLEERGNGYFSKGENFFKSMDNGALFRVFSTADNAEMPVFDEGEFRDANESELADMKDAINADFNSDPEFVRQLQIEALTFTRLNDPQASIDLF